MLTSMMVMTISERKMLRGPTVVRIGRGFSSLHGDGQDGEIESTNIPGKKLKVCEIVVFFTSRLSPTILRFDPLHSCISYQESSHVDICEV